MGQGSNLPYTDPWAVLGVPRDASREDVKAAFRRAALKCHPGKCAPGGGRQQPCLLCNTCCRA